MDDIVVPNDLWEENEEAVITSWLVEHGADVKEGQVIAELMVEKTSYEIFSPGDGIINIIKDIDDIVSKGQKIASLIN